MMPASVGAMHGEEDDQFADADSSVDEGVIDPSQLYAQTPAHPLHVPPPPPPVVLQQAKTSGDITVVVRKGEKDSLEKSKAVKPQAEKPKDSAKRPADKPKDSAKSKQSKQSESETRVETSEALVVPVSSVEAQVCRAARLIAQELEHGGWPEVSFGSRRLAAVALEEFATTIFLPNVLQESNAAPSSSESVFLATMLALREVLTQNAKRIFVIEKVPLEPHELQSFMSAPGAARRETEREEEEEQYVSQLLSTGVVLSTVQRLEKRDAEKYTSKFTQIMDSYDSGHGEFASMMEPMDGSHQGVQPDQTVLSNEENAAWKVAYNRANEAHPVLRKHGRTCQEEQRCQLGLPLPRESKKAQVNVPTPNAVLVSMVERPRSRASDQVFS